MVITMREAKNKNEITKRKINEAEANGRSTGRNTLTP